MTVAYLMPTLSLLFGSVHLSMPRHDYVKSGRLAVTDKTKPVYIFTHLKLYILFDYIHYKSTKKKIFEIHRVLKNKKKMFIFK